MIDILNSREENIEKMFEKKGKIKMPVDFDTDDLEYKSNDNFEIPDVVKKTIKVKQKTVGVNKKNNKNSLF